MVGRGTAEASNLKQGLDGEIVVSGFQLGRTVIEHHLVDELRMVILPVALGAGERFFGETGIQNPSTKWQPRRSARASFTSPMSSFETTDADTGHPELPH